MQEKSFITYPPETVDKVLEILREEIVPAEGCTEPIAVALAAAKALHFMTQ